MALQYRVLNDDDAQQMIYLKASVIHVSPLAAKLSVIRPYGSMGTGTIYGVRKKDIIFSNSGLTVTGVLYGGGVGGCLEIYKSLSFGYRFL